MLSAILLAGLLAYSMFGRAVKIDKYSDIDRPARIYPDYSSTVIPPNLAPLNFMVQEKGSYYHARIYCDKGEAIEVSSRSPMISIPIGPWHELLSKNRGGRLNFDVFVRTDSSNWVRYRSVTNKIADEDIDSYLVYRRMHPPFHYPIRGPIGIFQRDLRSFDEKLVLDNHHQKAGCINCHTFCGNRPDKMLLGVRSPEHGAITLLVEGTSVQKIDTKLGYSTWHPSGRLAAFSIDKLPMFFHTAGSNVSDTVDVDSSLAYFNAESKTVNTFPEISKKERLESWPMWSADGRYLYFCSGPMLWKEQTAIPPDGYNKVKYDLVRISYDIENDKWGKTETIISAADTGRSIAMPRTSPDGRWLTFCMFDNGFLPTWQQSSDLYIVDLKAARETGRYEYRKLNNNSDQSESWQSWSSNSRWMVFSSKREHGGFTRSYISYVDANGEAYKALIVPQKDPSFYTHSLEGFNTPEFTTGLILTKSKQLENAIRSSAQSSGKTSATTTAPNVKEAPKQEYLREVQ
jgi:hypothetical protein